MRSTNLLIAILLLCFEACAWNRRTAVKPLPGVLVDRFFEATAQAGFKLGTQPRICEWTRPSIISWRQEKNCVALSRWEELPNETRALINHWAGGETQARELFNVLFRWFFVPHELTHALQEVSGAPLGHALAERRSNDVAAAFLMTQARGPEALASIEKILHQSSGRWMIKDESSDLFFDRNYHELTRSPARYASFQFRFVLDSLSRRNELSLEAALRAATAGGRF